MMNSAIPILFLSISGIFAEDYDAVWNEYKKNNSLDFKSSDHEYYHEFMLLDNIRKIEQHNKRYEEGKETWKQGVTQFSYLSSEDFRKKMLTLKPFDKSAIDAELITKLNTSVPTRQLSNKNWKDEGRVTGVKNQGSCGSCWAFAVIGAVESLYAIRYKTLIGLSEQNLIDCDRNSYGCYGGYLHKAFEYVRDTGVTLEAIYPYTATKGSCRDSPSLMRIGDYKMLTSSESLIKEAVATIGPIAVSLNANLLQHYKEGILDDSRCPQNKNNHAVLIVGFGNQNGTDYWIVKNSWGRDWGENGYFRVVYGKNMCGITYTPMYPVPGNLMVGKVEPVEYLE